MGIYDDVEERPRRSLRDLEREVEERRAEQEALQRSTREAEESVAKRKAEVDDVARRLCIMLKTVRQEIARKARQKEELLRRPSAR